MNPFSCPRSAELRAGQAVLSHDLQRHIDRCDVCRETWLVASAMKSLTVQTSEVATSDTDAARIFVLARVTAERNRENRYRRLASALLAICLMAWAAAVVFGPGSLQASGSVAAMIAIAIVTVSWASAGSQTRFVARRRETGGSP